MMFVFEDIIMLDDRAIQLVLKEVDTKELAVALKGVGENTQARIFKNMSERAASMMKEEMEFMGPVRLRSVEESQQRIVEHHPQAGRSRRDHRRARRRRGDDRVTWP